VVFEVYKPNISGEANEWQQQIFLVDLNGETKALTEMENTGVGHTQPQWSPDGALISYIALADDAPNLFVMNRTRQQKTQITHSVTGVVSCHWSPDGRYIAYIAPDYPSEEKLAALQKSDAQVVGEHMCQLHVWVVDMENPGETRERRLTSGDFSVLSLRMLSIRSRGSPHTDMPCSGRTSEASTVEAGISARRTYATEEA